MLTLGVFLITLAIGSLAWALTTGKDQVRVRALANLRRGHNVLSEDEAGEHEEASSLTSAALLLTPKSVLRRLEKYHAAAGRPKEWPVGRLVILKPLLATVMAGLNLLLLAADSRVIFVLVASCATVVAYFLPELLLYSRGIERREAIGLELADTLDQMTIAVEAGLGFDAAMSRAGENGNGALSDELVRTLQDMRMGQSRRQAFEGLAQRSDVPDLRKFIRAVIQADKHGISIADVLRTQADELRLKRRQRAEEKAMQIPVKVIFPLMVCILPVLFIVLLGPAAIDMMGAFSS